MVAAHQAQQLESPVSLEELKQAAASMQTGLPVHTDSLQPTAVLLRSSGGAPRLCVPAYIWYHLRLQKQRMAVASSGHGCSLCCGVEGLPLTTVTLAVAQP
ncbi:hypothetical protein SKAU_G00030260 [Synaphobranchus kaupii]|uniref:Uncharacterized protein n=1 Tax=Synaphobranchus kaupii TaxID=118154 RepID=A0A9Q1GES4_SYNKA|nr:hypothetical protein SKAU_G00030260 [Synaphobranchus kaupii]